MELSFESKGLRRICENQDVAKLKLGEAVSEALRRRLADLRAAKSIYDIVVGRCRFEDAKDEQIVIIDLLEDNRLVFVANHPRNPALTDGSLDWSAITRIKIIQIGGDYVE